VPSVTESAEFVQSPDLSTAILSVSIVLFYLLFQAIVIFVATVGLDGECLYTFWLPQETWLQSPFWLVVSVVSLFMISSLLTVVRALLTSHKANAVFGIVAIGVVGFWLLGLNGLWKAMLFERGEISEAEWYGSESRALALLWGDKHVCKTGT
jgi:hypothetical protein